MRHKHRTPSRFALRSARPIPRQSSPKAINRHHVLTLDVGRTEFTLHATKGWRARRIPS